MQVKASYDSKLTPLLAPSVAFATLRAKMQLEENPDGEKPAEQRAFFALTSGGYGLLLDASIDQELIEVRDLCQIPGTPGWFKGLINLRSQIVPIFDLDNALYTTSSTALKRYALIVRHAEKRQLIQHGLLLDSLPQKRLFSTSANIQADLPSHPLLKTQAEQPCLTQCYRQDDPANQQIWWEWQPDVFFKSVCQRLQGVIPNQMMDSG